MLTSCGDVGRVRVLVLAVPFPPPTLLPTLRPNRKQTQNKPKIDITPRCLDPQVRALSLAVKTSQLLAGAQL